MAEETKTNKVTLEELCREQPLDDRRIGEATDRQGHHHRRRVQSTTECGAGELSIRAEIPSLKITVPVFTSIANLPLDATNIVFLAAKNVARS